MGAVPALTRQLEQDVHSLQGSWVGGHRTRPQAMSLGTRWTVSGGEAAGKVLQSQGRNKQSQKKESLPSPWSLGTGWQSGQSDVHSVCGGKVCVAGVGGGERGRSGAGWCWAQEGHE